MAQAPSRPADAAQAARAVLPSPPPSSASASPALRLPSPSPPSSGRSGPALGYKMAALSGGGGGGAEQARLCSTGTWSSRPWRRGPSAADPAIPEEEAGAPAPLRSRGSRLMFILGERGQASVASSHLPPRGSALRDWLFPPGPPPPGRSSLRKHTQWPRGVSLVRALGLGIRAAVVEQEAINRGETRGWSEEGHGWLEGSQPRISWMFSLFLGGGRVGGSWPVSW